MSRRVNPRTREPLPVPFPPLLLLNKVRSVLRYERLGFQSQSLLEHEHLVRVDGIYVVVNNLRDILTLKVSFFIPSR
jgi:hypothetical protein